ncbi:nuclear transport factor 2 family protein [Sphaerisporangium sp. TRM90804]|uniref:nuclear transport factor 2 family protein n=1 Tax=Sphaerisporangium sp. TRM90804 TaxID=3031113 RepID=UPI00244A8767|nr:nuclear transport factor 2 family protein [Sphaerisporangium sp. TRM90804]MDH2424099.1 nuclear transport factor 2 family protein [Sphaerisporangium sp. TRM90804]
MSNYRTPRRADHLRLIRRFYDAFAQADTEVMGRCYHPDVSFGDAVLTEVEGRDRVMAMWRMLLDGGGVEVTARDITADDHSATAHRTMRYVYPPTGRRVVSNADVLFRFEDGLIVRHHDEFDFRRWSTMAYGRPIGLLFAKTPALRRRVREQARRRLDQYLRSISPISG